MRTRIRFQDQFPEALRSEVQHDLERFLFMLPEIRILYVAMKGSDADIEGEAAIQPLRHYHTAHLWLDPTFWGLDTEERLKTLVHELMHIKLDPLTRECFALIDEFAPRELVEFLIGRLREAEETVVDDMSHVFYDAMYEYRAISSAWQVEYED